jgi:hypothetical protein
LVLEEKSYEIGALHCDGCIITIFLDERWSIAQGFGLFGLEYWVKERKSKRLAG